MTPPFSTAQSTDFAFAGRENRPLESLFAKLGGGLCLSGSVLEKELPGSVNESAATARRSAIKRIPQRIATSSLLDLVAQAASLRDLRCKLAACGISAASWQPAPRSASW